VNEIFNPSRVDTTFYQSPEVRAATITEARNTNYGVVRLELIEHIYDTIYSQRIQYGNSSEAEQKWPHRILPYRGIDDVKESPVIPGGIRLHLRDASSKYLSGLPNQSDKEEIFDADVVFVATGYKRDLQDTLLADARTLKAGGEKADSKWTVSRDYRVQFDQEKVSEGAGVWLQGCCEATHGVGFLIVLISDPNHPLTRTAVE